MKADVLFDRIDRVRRRERLVSVTAGAAKTVLAGVGLLVGFFLLDWLILSRAVEGAGADRVARAVLMLAVLATFAYAVWQSVWREIARSLDDDEIALRVEGRHPELRGRLISTIQLTREMGRDAYVGSEELVRALEEDTVSFTRALNFFDIVNVDTLKKVGGAALGLLVLSVALGAWQADWASALIRRMLLAKTTYPTATRIFSVSEGGVVPRGESYPVEVEIDPEGHVPETVTLLVRLADVGTTSKVELEKADRVGPSGGVLYAGELRDVLENADYTVRAYDARWGRWEILRVLRRPAIKALELAYDYPDYCGAPDEVRHAGGIQALVGTKVRITARLSKAATSAKLALHLRQEIGEPVEIDLSADGLVATADLEVRENGSYKIMLRDSQGLDSNPVTYMIDALRDRKPKVRIVFPARDKTVTKFAAWPVRFEARDDYGIARGWLRYRVEEPSGSATGAEEEKPPEMSLRLGGLVRAPRQKSVQAETVFNLDRVTLEGGRELEAGMRVVYRIEVEDNRTTEADEGANEGADGDAGIGKSREYAFTIASVEEVQYLIDSARDEALGRIEELREREIKGKEGVDTIRRTIRRGGADEAP
ncbi:MAG: DUF4175 family protein [Planctomycetota bacterium]|jgi:hypothetical protein